MSCFRSKRGAVRWGLLVVLTAAVGTAVWTLGAADEEAGGTSRLIVPVFAETRPAENPVGLNLVLDAGKVLGWISGPEDYSGREVQVTYGDKERTVLVQRDNTFTWHYRVDEPVDATFAVGELRAAERLKPRDPARPTAFFVVDRNAYRPNQTLRFAGFLREPDRRGEFVPIRGRDVEVTLTSKQKKTVAARLELTSDNFGRITGEYKFTAADALDTYELAIKDFAGKAEVTLAEFRKAKVRLKIDSAADGNHLKLKFQAVDFLDKPVPGTKVHFTAQVVRASGGGREYPLKAEQFVYHEPWPWDQLDPERLEEDEQLLWEAGIPLFGAGSVGSTVLAQHEADLSMGESGYAEHTIELQPGWFTSEYAVLVQGVLVDYNGREQRAARRIPLAKDAPTAANRIELDLPKRRYATGETIRVRAIARDARGEPVDVQAALVVMRLSPGTNTLPTAYPIYLNRGAAWNWYPQNQLGYRSATPYYPRRRPWPYVPLQTAAVHRETVTATVVDDGAAELTLDQPGPYKLVCYAKLPDGRRLSGEVGCIVRRTDEMPGLVLKLDREVLATGDTLSGELHSRFADARVLLTLRDSSGLRWWRTCRLEGSAVRLAERLPAGLHYGCRFEAQYLDSKGKTHLAGRFLRVLPKERIVNVEIDHEEIYAPGEEVEINLSVDRPEPVDLVVSVFDQSLLGIAPDKAVDPANFFLADERVRKTAARHMLRRQLGGVTVRELIERGEAMLKDDPELAKSPEGAMLKNAVDQYRQSRYVNGPNLLVLLGLAGVDAFSDPIYHNYFGSNWYWQYDASEEEKSPMRLFDLLDFERDGWRLRFRFSGGAVAVIEYHPSHLQHYLNNYIQYGQVFRGRGQMYGQWAARGDARHSVTANAMFSDMPAISGQAFISHMPAPAAEVALIDADQPGVSVRRDFSDAALFDAKVRTDRDGRASVKLKLPDSLTNWQVVVTAISPRMHVGHAKSSFRTFKPIMV